MSIKSRITPIDYIDHNELAPDSNVWYLQSQVADNYYRFTVVEYNQ